MIRTEQRSGACVTDPPASQRFRIAASSPPSGLFSLGLQQRLVLFAILFAAEWIPVSHLVQTHLVHRGQGAVGPLLQLAVVFGCFFLAFAYRKAGHVFEQLSNQLRESSIGWGFLPAHLAALLGFVGLLFLPHGSNPSFLSRSAMAVLFSATGALSIALCLLAFVPAKVITRLLRATGAAWLQALVIGLVAWTLIQSFPLWNGVAWNPANDLAWKPATDFTFSLVNGMLHLFLPVVVADRANMTIGSPSFRVEIAPGCAGFEGTALMMVFCVAWLWSMRREFRFPQALVLIPAGMTVMWLANAVRITILVLIGVAGAPNVAVGGFHSQAGWIAFNCVALGLAVLSQRIPWVARNARAASHAVSGNENATAAYLMPFLVILGSAMISRAVSGGFEWLYPLRFLAAAGTLWYFRSKYADLDWKFDWVSVLNGIGVFAIWMGLDALAGTRSDNTIASGLALLPTPARIAWIVFRTAAACVTVPIAEELAFRGFLIRRLMSANFETPDFETLDPRRYTVVALLFSSIVFGLLHGDRWLAGTVAGLLYAAAFLRRGRIGDAVIAHATTNALLAACVLLGGNWSLW